jgi:periplasmic protein TonB
MKFNRLKFIATGIIAFAISSLMISCNGDSENSSKTTENEVKAPDSLGTATTPGTTVPTPAVKKKGKVSSNMEVKADATAKMEQDKMGYYNYTETLPEYNGGQNALDNYINNNIEYPQDAIDNNIEGTVSVQFAVDEHGAISNVKTVGNKVGYGLEEEAVKVVSKMPKWTAGQIKGKNVKTWRILPITYKLEG